MTDPERFLLVVALIGIVSVLGLCASLFEIFEMRAESLKSADVSNLK